VVRYHERCETRTRGRIRVTWLLESRMHGVRADDQIRVSKECRVSNSSMSRRKLGMRVHRVYLPSVRANCYNGGMKSCSNTLWSERARYQGKGISEGGREHSQHCGCANFETSNVKHFYT